MTNVRLLRVINFWMGYTMGAAQFGEALRAQDARHARVIGEMLTMNYSAIGLSFALIAAVHLQRTTMRDMDFSISYVLNYLRSETR